MEYILAYFAAISLVAVIITITDKSSAVRHGRRVPEATLLTIAALGGSVAMYITMQLIRHKTRKMKFMLGIPAIMALQCTALYFITKYLGDKL